MSWTIDFISEEDFTNHVCATIQKYGDKLDIEQSGEITISFKD